MKNYRKDFTRNHARASGLVRNGMTLMEVVIAIGVVAFVVPLILAATTSAGNSRRNAEADTRSAWITRQVQQEILAKWATPEHPSVITTPISFPAFSSKASPTVLAYDRDGEFVAAAPDSDLTARSTIAGAVYLVSVYGEEYFPPNLIGAATRLSRLHIHVHHPANVAPSRRSIYRYNLISSRQGIL
ncbi:MAG: hypothetical protein H7Y36_09225 [Armatimonadetes bacterium]|nr:hypothetical protein [Akkermansiaceae bacterium]